MAQNQTRRNIDVAIFAAIRRVVVTVQQQRWVGKNVEGVRIANAAHDAACLHILAALDAWRGEKKG